MPIVNKFLLDMTALLGANDPRTVVLGAIGILVFLILMAFALRASRHRKGAVLQIMNLKDRVGELEGSLNAFEKELDSRLTEFRNIVEEVRYGIRSLGGELKPVTQKPKTPSAQPSTSFEVPQTAAAPLQGFDVAQSQSGLKSGLKRTRDGFFTRLKRFFQERDTINEASLFELEELLLAADIGVSCSTRILDQVRRTISSGGAVDKEGLYSKLRDELMNVMMLSPNEERDPIKAGTSGNPRIILLVGVNGVGKTTTAAKLAKLAKDHGAKPLLVAADTFRAAAVEQLVMWGDRLDIPVVSGAADAKPATVIFDALDRAILHGHDLILIDTAGRLHTKNNLMQELEGVRNVLSKRFPGAPDETLLVVDGVTGNNALTQAREFNAITPLTGIIVTKLDGSPKGGIVVAIRDELKLPVRYVGIGEHASDLLNFDPQVFVDSLVPEDEYRESVVWA